MSFLITLLIVVPGIAATLAIFKPGQAKLPTQLACILCLGQVAIAAWAFVLVILRIFVPATFFGGLALITGALFFVAFRRGGFKERARAIVEEVRGEGLVTAIAFGAVLFFALTVLRGQSSLVNFGIANPYRYWADAMEVADVGRVPEATLQWGQLYAPTVSKLAFNAFNGAFTFLSDNPLKLMGPLLNFSLVGMAFAGWALGREMGLRYLAPLLAILSGPGTEVFRHSLIMSPQRWYAGEAFARLALVIGMALAINVLRNRDDDRRWIAVAAGIALGVAGTTHLVPTVIGIGLLTFYAIFFLILERTFKHVFRLALIVGGVFFLFVLAGLFGSGGDAAFNTVKEDQEIDTLGGTFDPTRFLASGVIQQPPEFQPGPRAELYDGWYDDPDHLFQQYVRDSTSTDVEGSAPYIIFFAIGAVSIALLFVAPRKLRPIPAAGFALWASLLLVTLGMSYLYDTYVPGAFPQRRLWSYDTFMLVVVGLGVAEMALFLLARFQKWVPVALAGGLIVYSTIGTAAPTVPDITKKHGADTVRAMNWINANLPCDARILANQRTGGQFQALTGRAAITEGMAPYLRPPMLSDVIELLLDGRAFFAAPAENTDVLHKYSVSHVVVAKTDYLLDKNPPLLGRSDPALVRQAEGLELVHSSRLMAVYEVTGADTSGVPTAADHAGYDCRTEPIELPEEFAQLPPLE